MQVHLRQTLEHFGVTAPADLGEPLKYRTSWIFADDPTRCRAPDVDDLSTIADQIGVDLQELLLGNPEGAPLRTLDEQMRQAVAEPQPAALPSAAWFLRETLPPDGASIIAQDMDGFVDQGKFIDGKLDDSVVSWSEVVRWTLHPEDEAYTEPVQQTTALQPTPIWHPYPDERPADGQTVLTRKSTGYYSALTYRDGAWFLPGFADSEMDVHVDWWSAELAPEEGENEK